MEKLILIILIIIVIAFIVHWADIPIGTYIDQGLDWIFRQVSNITSRISENFSKSGKNTASE